MLIGTLAKSDLSEAEREQRRNAARSRWARERGAGGASPPPPPVDRQALHQARREENPAYRAHTTQVVLEERGTRRGPYIGGLVGGALGAGLGGVLGASAPLRGRVGSYLMGMASSLGSPLIYGAVRGVAAGVKRFPRSGWPIRAAAAVGGAAYGAARQIHHAGRWGQRNPRLASGFVAGTVGGAALVPFGVSVGGAVGQTYDAIRTVRRVEKRAGKPLTQREIEQRRKAAAELCKNHQRKFERIPAHRRLAMLQDLQGAHQQHAEDIRDDAVRHALKLKRKRGSAEWRAVVDRRIARRTASKEGRSIRGEFDWGDIRSRIGTLEKSDLSEKQIEQRRQAALARWKGHTKKGREDRGPRISPIYRGYKAPGPELDPPAKSARAIEAERDWVGGARRESWTRGSVDTVGSADDPSARARRDARWAQAPRLANAVAQMSPEQKTKISRVMREWKQGKLQTSTRATVPVGDRGRRQALAIALSEARRLPGEKPIRWQMPSKEKQIGARALRNLSPNDLITVRAGPAQFQARVTGRGSRSQIHARALLPELVEGVPVRYNQEITVRPYHVFAVTRYKDTVSKRDLTPKEIEQRREAAKSRWLKHRQAVGQYLDERPELNRAVTLVVDQVVPSSGLAVFGSGLGALIGGAAGAAGRRGTLGQIARSVARGGAKGAGAGALLGGAIGLLVPSNSPNLEHHPEWAVGQRMSTKQVRETLLAHGEKTGNERLIVRGRNGVVRADNIGNDRSVGFVPAALRLNGWLRGDEGFRFAHNHPRGEHTGGPPSWADFDVALTHPGSHHTVYAAGDRAGIYRYRAGAKSNQATLESLKAKSKADWKATKNTSIKITPMQPGQTTWSLRSELAHRLYGRFDALLRGAAKSGDIEYRSRPEQSIRRWQSLNPGEVSTARDIGASSPEGALNIAETVVAERQAQDRLVARDQAKRRAASERRAAAKRRAAESVSKRLPGTPLTQAEQRQREEAARSPNRKRGAGFVPGAGGAAGAATGTWLTRQIRSSGGSIGGAVGGAAAAETDTRDPHLGLSLGSAALGIGGYMRSARRAVSRFASTAARRFGGRGITHKVAGRALIGASVPLGILSERPWAAREGQRGRAWGEAIGSGIGGLAGFASGGFVGGLALGAAGSYGGSKIGGAIGGYFDRRRQRVTKSDLSEAQREQRRAAGRASAEARRRNRVQEAQTEHRVRRVGAYGDVAASATGALVGHGITHLLMRRNPPKSLWVRRALDVGIPVISAVGADLIGRRVGESLGQKVVKADPVQESSVADLPDGEAEFSIECSFFKTDDEKRMVYGWASVIEENGIPIVDRQGDVIEVDELQKAVHEFMKHRTGGEQHSKMGTGEVVESMVLTKDVQKSLGIDLGKVGWYVGMKISDEDVWKRIKSGELAGFSIGGRGKRVPLEEVA